MVRCPECGRSNPSSNRYCGNCGYPLKASETEDWGSRTEDRASPYEDRKHTTFQLHGYPMVKETVKILRTKHERGSLWKFGSIQIGYAAAFGGLAFVSRLLRIGVPIVGGRFLIEPRDVASIVGPGFAGPIGAIIIGALASTFGLELLVYIPLCILWALIYRYFRHPWYYVPLTVGLLTVWPWYWAVWQVVGDSLFSSLPPLPFPPFWPTFVAGLTSSVVYVPSCIILTEVLRKCSPRAKGLIG